MYIFVVVVFIPFSFETGSNSIAQNGLTSTIPFRLALNISTASASSVLGLKLETTVTYYILLFWCL